VGLKRGAAEKMQTIIEGDESVLFAPKRLAARAEKGQRNTHNFIRQVTAEILK